MQELNRLLLENLPVIVAVLAALLLVALIGLVVVWASLRRVERRYRALTRDTGGGSLEEVLDQHVARVMTVAGGVEELRSLYAGIEERTRTALRHVGMVRFNPFEDTGSDQSFVIALLDDRRDGIVISSLHGRNATRVFAKPVEGGRSRHSLSDEETQAIQIAIEGTQAIGAGR